MQSTVRALFVFPEKKASPISLAEVRVGASGFEGDFHARTANRRQILLLSNDVLQEFGLDPGTLSENMVIDGVDVMKLKPGQHLQVGDVVVEVTLPCEPCIQMDRIRRGLKEALNGKRGMFARVVTPGKVRIGDIVRQP